MPIFKNVIYLTTALLCSISVTFAEGLRRDSILAPDGVTLSVIESGNPEGPAVLFIHGFSQSAMSWRLQMESKLQQKYRLIAMDLRGHGYSGKPETPESYIASKLWADDIAAVANAKGLDRFTLIGWSYGGLPVLDYVATHGQGKLSGLVFVATGYNLDLRPPEAGGPEPVLGPGVIENTGHMAGIPAGPPDADLDGCGASKTCGEYSRQFAGTKRFLDMAPSAPLPRPLADETLAYNLQTPPYVRRSMVIDRFVVGGPLDHSPTLKQIKVPVLLLHGGKDQHVLPRSTEIMQSLIDQGGTSTKRIVYDNLGHVPFLEDAARVNADLDKFLDDL